MKIDNAKFGKYADTADEVDRGLIRAERKIKRDKQKRKTNNGPTKN